MFKILINAVINGIAKALEKLMIVLAVTMMLSLSWQVFTRFVIKQPSTWTEEIARYSFIYLVMIGASLGVKNSAHFGMTMLSDKMHGRTRDLYQRFVINGIIMLAALFMLIIGTDFAVSYGMNRVSPTFLVPMAWVFGIVPVSAVFMIMFSFQNMAFGDFSKDPHAFELGEETY